jgi:nicotinate-nucleotide adenylyltransferase
MREQKSGKMKIGIFGGTFDPPHKGHLALARRAKKQFHLDSVYFVPAFIQPHKLQHTSSTAQHRLAMVKMVLAGKQEFKVSDIELKRRGISYTVDTLKWFKKQFPTAEFVLLLGADSLEQFMTWKSPKTILRLASLAVYKRHGFHESFKKSIIAFKPIKGQLLQVSSTEVRNRMRKGMPISRFITKDVLQYIKKHSLYRPITVVRKRKRHEINCTS